MNRIFSCVFVALSLAPFALGGPGCAPDLKPRQEQPHSDGGAADGPPKTRVVPGRKVVSKDLGDGVTQVTINSSDDGLWIYFSFSSGRQVEPTDAAKSDEWDIAFQRYLVKSNGGVHGIGKVEVAYVDDRDFDSIQAAPSTGYHADKDDGDDVDKDPDTPFLIDGAWYAYNPRDHTLSPRKRVYILKGVEGLYFKLQFLEYYDDKGNSGFPSFKWSKIEPPE